MEKKMKRSIRIKIVTGLIAGVVGTGGLSMVAGAGVDYVNAGIITLNGFDYERVANADNIKAVQAAVPICVKHNVGSYSSPVYENLVGLDIRLYKLKDIESWKQSCEEIAQVPNGNYSADAIREDIRKNGMLVEEWTSSGEAHISRLEKGFYVAVDENLSGMCGFVTFEVNEKGEWREGPDYTITYNYSTNKYILHWDTMSAFQTTDAMMLVAPKRAAYVHFYIAVNDKNGTDLSQQSKIELYRKNGSKLEKKGIECLELRDIKDNYNRNLDAFEAEVLYPGTYVIKCISVPDGYRKFKDITFTIVRKDTGHPVFDITDKNGSNVKISGMFMDGVDYFYSTQDSLEAGIGISLNEVIKAESVKLNKTAMVLDKGKTDKLTATVFPVDTDNKTVTWSSSDPKVATVDSSGNVTAVNHGTAKITATTANGKTAACEVRVNFADVASESLYYYKPVYWAAENGITTGSNGLFAPHNKCTREHAITFLWRMAGSPVPKSMNSKFKDIQNKNSYSYKAIMWGTENGIITGANGVFAPNNTCTREQIVTMLWRMAGKPEPKNTTSKFKDVQNKNSYSYKAILWAAEKGITTGANGSFAPGKVCTRAEIVTFIYRYKN